VGGVAWSGVVGGGGDEHASHGEGTWADGGTVGNGEVKVGLEKSVEGIWCGRRWGGVKGGARVDDRAYCSPRRPMASVA
jgi:hypothetical protein